jgi:hypothetical protein
MFIVKLLAGVAQHLVLPLGIGIGQERFHPLADALKLGLLHDGFAQFAGLLDHRVFGLDFGFAICLHNADSLNAPAGGLRNLPAIRAMRQPINSKHHLR